MCYGNPHRDHIVYRHSSILLLGSNQKLASMDSACDKILQQITTNIYIGGSWTLQYSFEYFYFTFMICNSKNKVRLYYTLVLLTCIYFHCLICKSCEPLENQSA